MSGPESRIRHLLGADIRRSEPLTGGCVARVLGVTLVDGRRAVVKFDPEGHAGLEVEAFMLRWLGERTRLPVPAVLAEEPGLLIMEWMPGQTGCSRAAEAHAADLLAALHGLAENRFGFDRDTRIGGLPQPNPWTASWREFFGQHRLLHMARSAQQAGRLAPRVADRVERLADHLGRWIDEPDRPALIHGDVWSGNVLASGDRITAFLDPALYYAHAEVELAFITLFDCFGPAFFGRYAEIRPIRPGFFETRRDLYNLYPLLVHTRLFGGAYAASVERTLDRFAV